MMHCARILGCFLVVTLFTNTIHTRERFPNPLSENSLVTKNSQSRDVRAAAASEGLATKTKNILAQFFQMIMNFFAILQNPHNAANVTANITDMLAGMVNIVAEGIKSGNLLLDGDDHFQEAYRSMLSKKLLAYRLNLLNLS